MNLNISKNENHSVGYQIFKAMMLLLFLVYIAGMLCLLFLERAFSDASVFCYKNPDMSYLNVVRAHLLLTPLKTIKEYSKVVLQSSVYDLLTEFSESNFAFCNLLGNIVLFMPLGIFIPYFFKRYRCFFRFAPLMLFITFSIESVQLLTLTGKFDIDDIILNLTGGCMGCILFSIMQGIVLLYSKSGMMEEPQI
ncbi:MAG TPA: hypothetical protein DCO72_09215 [Ruminococcus sp.]|nr:hypothetical protein [Ruminococcus sp.]